MKTNLVLVNNLIRPLLAAAIAEKELAFLTLIVSLSIVVPHPPNVSPLASLGLFVGCYVSRKYLLLLPVIGALVADLFTTGLYTLTVLAFVYFGHFASSIIGRYGLRHQSLPLRLPIAIFLTSFVFFILSNFGNWLAFYPKTLTDLVQCYVNGLPYFQNTLLGNCFYSILFFGSYELFKTRLDRFSSGPTPL